MIPCVFKTNLDLVTPDKSWWPKAMPFRPQVGDLVRSGYEHPGAWNYHHNPDGSTTESLVGKGVRLELEVVRVTIVTDNAENWSEGRFKHLEVELHLPSGRWESLRSFYEDFYEKITGHKFI